MALVADLFAVPVLVGDVNGEALGGDAGVRPKDRPKVHFLRTLLLPAFHDCALLKGG
jgi:hypothetical protein